MVDALLRYYDLYRRFEHDLDIVVLFVGYIPNLDTFVLRKNHREIHYFGKRFLVAKMIVHLSYIHKKFDDVDVMTHRYLTKPEQYSSALAVVVVGFVEYILPIQNVD